MNDKKIVIAGAGGFAQEVLGYLAFERFNSKKNINIKGIIVDGYNSGEVLPGGLPYLGSIKEYTPVQDEVVLVCIGENPGRKKVIEHLQLKDARFYSFISSLAYINPSAKIGVGSVIAPFCIVNANVKLGDFALMNSYSAIGHDSVVGDHAILYPYAAINGSCQVGDNLIMGTRATIFPGTRVGHNCTITTHSYVKNDKGDNRFIHIKAKEIDLENRL